MTKTMTAEQAEVLNEVWSEIIAIISAECYKRHLNRIVDSILSDAITRVCESIAKSGTTKADRIKSRARSCALDAIRSAARAHKSYTQVLDDIGASSRKSHYHNHSPQVSPVDNSNTVEPDEADPALCACVRVTDKKNRHSHFEFFSFGFEPIESAA